MDSVPNLKESKYLGKEITEIDKSSENQKNS